MMESDTTKLTIRLPREQVKTLKDFAAANGLTATEVISRYLRHLQAATAGDLSPALRDLVGIIPAEVDLDRLREDYLNEKYRS